jgi:hypothetical protein
VGISPTNLTFPSIENATGLFPILLNCRAFSVRLEVPRCSEREHDKAQHENQQKRPAALIQMSAHESAFRMTAHIRNNNGGSRITKFLKSVECRVNSSELPKTLTALSQAGPVRARQGRENREFKTPAETTVFRSTTGSCRLQVPAAC